MKDTNGWVFSDEVIDKAKSYVVNQAVKDLGGFWTVQGSSARPYSVHTDADAEAGTASWISCSCEHGRLQGAGKARCSHAVAVLLTIRKSS